HDPEMACPGPDPGWTPVLGKDHCSANRARRGCMTTTDRSLPEESSRARPRLGLSGKLLVLTLAFVMIAEVLIYVPPAANFRTNYLHDKISRAYPAPLVLEIAPSGVPDPR